MAGVARIAVADGYVDRMTAFVSSVSLGLSGTGIVVTVVGISRRLVLPVPITLALAFWTGCVFQ
jgi:hypothetical protein